MLWITFLQLQHSREIALQFNSSPFVSATLILELKFKQMKMHKLNCSGSPHEDFSSPLRGAPFPETQGSLPQRPARDPVLFCAHQCITKMKSKSESTLLIWSLVFILKKTHKAPSSFILPCSLRFQLANLRWNPMARILLCREGSWSVPPLFPSFGQPSMRVRPPVHWDRCFPPITVISHPQEPWTPSCFFTAWNKTKLRSFFFFLPRPSKQLLYICKAPVAAWVFSKRHAWVAERVPELNHAAECRGKGRKGFQGDTHSEAGLGNVLCHVRVLFHYCVKWNEQFLKVWHF